ncbi:MAG: alpha/beta fold hydrolase [Acidimicrobiia bacterium]
MPYFRSGDDASLYYDDQGDGAVVLLLHGFVGDVNIDWIRSGILDRLLDEGYRTIAYDARGHGLSDKPHDPSAYAGDILSGDASALLDTLEIERCFVIGFSLGAQTALRLSTLDARVRAVVALGLGETILTRVGPSTDEGAAVWSLAAAMRADDPDTITQPGLRHYREMADAIRADRQALAALMDAPRIPVVEFLDEVKVPVLFVTGSDDPAGAPNPLAARLEDALAVTTAGDHAGVRAQAAAQEAIVEFLDAHA